MRYLALTTGPIYDLMKQARSVRELWTASYFFSKITEIVIDSYPNNKLELLSPSKIDSQKCRYGAGVYPEKVFWKIISEFTNEDIIQFKENVFKELLNQINSHNVPLVSSDYLTKFLKFSFVIGDYSQDDLDKKSYISRLNSSIDSLELYNHWTFESTYLLIDQLIAKGKFDDPHDRPVYKWRQESSKNCGESLYFEFQGQKFGRFPSIIEVTTKPLAYKQKEWFDENIYKPISVELDKKVGAQSNLISDLKDKGSMDNKFMEIIKKEFDEKGFKSAHKYICFVQSDGDGVGSFIANTKSDPTGKAFNSFSKLLNKFSIEASKIVHDYGGMPVYSGGDDLLFYAPVFNASKSDNTIIHLLSELDSFFKRSIDEKLSLSFGLSITYYKYPMKEALESCHELLIKKAKKDDKHKIACNIEKHSGQNFQMEFKLDSQYFERVKELINLSIGEKENFLNSLMYKLDDQKMVLANILDESQSDRDSRLKNFFMENFNESYKNKKKFFDSFSEYLIHWFSYMKWNLNKTSDDYDKVIKPVYSTLRFIHFLNATDEQ